MDRSQRESPVATVGIISIGDMGCGIAQLLVANNYRVITNASERSQATQDRAKRHSIELFDTDAELRNTADFILSIVPPYNAIATARRFLASPSTSNAVKRTNSLYFLDLNAISPRSAREIDDLFAQSEDVKFIDGGIIGGPPRLKDDGTWYRPSIPLSGPHQLDETVPGGEQLASILNVKHINATIGSATGLKMCFASLSKGFTALAIQSYATAHKLGVLGELESHLDLITPGVRQRAEKSLVSMPPKAYRWVHEMKQIAETFEADGGFSAEESCFRGIAQIYELVANGTDLGQEKTETRVRGTTPGDVAGLVAEGMRKRKLKSD